MERVPDYSVWRDPGTRQSYHIEFTAAKWDDEANKLEDARATIWCNGVIVHNEVFIKKANGGIKVTPG